MDVNYVALLTTRNGMPEQVWKVYYEELFHAVAKHCEIPFHQQSFSLTGDPNVCIIAILPTDAREAFKNSLVAVRDKFDGSNIVQISGKTTFV